MGTKPCTAGEWLTYRATNRTKHRLKKKSKEVKEDTNTRFAALEATIQALSAQIGTKRKADDISTTESETSVDTLNPTKKTRIKSTKRG